MLSENPHFWLNIILPKRVKVYNETTSYTPSSSKLCNLLKELHGEVIFTNNRWMLGKRKVVKKVRFLLLEVDDDLPYCRYKYRQESGQLHALKCKNFAGIEELGEGIWLYRSRILSYNE